MKIRKVYGHDQAHCVLNALTYPLYYASQKAHDETGKSLYWDQQTQ